MAIRKYFSEEEEATLVKAIRWAEDKTSGEIRIHIEEKCTGDPFNRGLEIFAQLGMHQTDLKNGVLFYIATETHRFSIIADENINNKVPSGFWDNIRDEMVTHFKAGNLVGGLELGVLKAGEALKEFFPRQDVDANELSDEISAQ